MFLRLAMEGSDVGEWDMLGRGGRVIVGSKNAKLVLFRYFKSRLGFYCETGWLTDTFGLTGQLPQVRFMLSARTRAAI